MAEHITFRGVDKKKFTSAEHTDDYINAEQFKKVRLGQLALYYKDFWRKVCVPYDYIHRAYKAAVIVTPDDSPPIEYYRLILHHDGEECANIIFSEHDNDLVDRLVLRIGEIHPETALGYVEPPKTEKKKKSFWK